MAGKIKGIGGVLAPVRFLLFMGVAIVAVPTGIFYLGWRLGTMAGFDLAAIVFLGACWSLLNNRADEMREAASRNDANRALLLVISAFVMLAVLVSVASELTQKGSSKPSTVIAIVTTLVLCWVFTNIVYTLHYAHLFYGDTDGDGSDDKGLEFPKTEEPDYWDFIYFSFCLAMCFQTSDTAMTNGQMRRVATGHCLLAFVFNIGVLAFTINVLGGG